MKKKEFKKKLSLNKQKITGLNKQEQANIKGGGEETQKIGCYSYRFHCFPDSINVC